MSAGFKPKFIFDDTLRDCPQAIKKQRLHCRHDDEQNDRANIPPTTPVASGRCTWLPMPVDTAAGSNPMQADKAVISIGRIRAMPHETWRRPRSCLAF